MAKKRLVIATITAAAAVVSAGAVLFFLPPSSSERPAVDLAELLAERAPPADPPADPPKIPEPPELADLEVAGDASADDAVADIKVAQRPASRPKQPRPPATLTADAVSDVMKRAAEKLRACDDAPRGWVAFAVQVRDRRAILQKLGLDAPGPCARKVVATLRFPAGAGEFRGSLRL